MIFGKSTARNPGLQPSQLNVLRRLRCRLEQPSPTNKLLARRHLCHGESKASALLFLTSTADLSSCSWCILPSCDICKLSLEDD
mmetsp:Transcript_21519/g.42277  ORF Transcript_21519/g.42277 Transcript_21519/m.42277 type:complete len:84 (-) Transcript_21519:941-1192(-)